MPKQQDLKIYYIKGPSTLERFQIATKLGKVFIVFDEIFKISLVTYLLLLLAETIKEGFVSYFFNLNWLLGVVLVSGIIMVLTQHENPDMADPNRKTHGHPVLDEEYKHLLHKHFKKSQLKNDRMGLVLYSCAQHRRRSTRL